MLPFENRPWAKTMARIVICTTLIALAGLGYFLHSHNALRIPEIVFIILVILTIIPPNLAVLYPKLLQQPAKRGSKSSPRIAH
jgi:Mg2+/Co2+ transporter CorB